jgi:hypothetical protein
MRIVRRDSQGRFFTTSIYRKVHPHSHFPASCALVCRPSLSICSCLVVRVVVFNLMAREGLPVLEVIGAAEAGNPTEVVRPEEHATSSSLDRSSDTRRDSTTASQEEESTVVDPSEASRSYRFVSSTVTVSRIPEMASLHYFDEGDVQAPREEVILEPADDEVVVFDEFFTAGLRMPPRPSLINIMLKFRVQLQQLTPDAIVQLSKYF